MTVAIRRALLLSAALAATAGAQATPRGPRGQTGLVYAGSASIWLDAPTGWILDPEAGRSQGPPAVLYRQGESWEQGTAVMYINPSARPPRELGVIIRDDEAEFRGHAADMQVRTLPAIRLPNGDTATVRTYLSGTLSNYDAVAYVAAGRAVWLFVLTARSREAFDRAVPAFRELVSSYAPGPTVHGQRP